MHVQDSSTDEEEMGGVMKKLLFRQGKTALSLKEEGNAAFKLGSKEGYHRAVARYAQALLLDPEPRLQVLSPGESSMRLSNANRPRAGRLRSCPIGQNASFRLAATGKPCRLATKLSPLILVRAISLSVGAGAGAGAVLLPPPPSAGASCPAAAILHADGCSAASSSWAVLSLRRNTRQPHLTVAVIMHAGHEKSAKRKEKAAEAIRRDKEQY